MKEIKLTQGQVALVDDEDYGYLSQFKWYAQNTKSGFYAVRKGADRVCILMHRQILKIVDKKIKADHEDRNTLNNQKYNLRSCSHSQNMSNRRVCKTSSSKFLGVHFCNTRKKFTASVMSNNRRRFFGYFDNEIDAAVAYNKGALELHGEFANLNTFVCGN